MSGGYYDAWLPQNHWGSREKYNETHDIDGNRELAPPHPSTRPGPPKPGTLEAEDLLQGYASRAMEEYVNQHITLAEAMGRVGNAARQLARTTTETELHDEVRECLGDHQYANE